MPLPLAPANPLPFYRQRRRQDRGGDGDDDEFERRSTLVHRRQHGRFRSTSFDDTGAVFGKTSSSHLNKEGATKNYLPVANISPTLDDRHQNSLLTTFLLHINSLLRDYCHHLASTSEDTVNAIANAAKAIGVLERGKDTLYSIINQVSSSHESTAAGTTTSAPSSPQLSHQRKDLSPQMLISRHSMWSTSPSKKKHTTPPQQSTTHVLGSGRIKWNNVVVETEWERFVSPFMNLVGAECLYTRMEHVLNPERWDVGREGTNPKQIKRKEKSSVSLFDRQERSSSTSSHRDNVHPPHLLPHPSPLDTGKLGSRRLIATYRQVRADLIIVGEYLCDPVLGARLGDIPTSTSNYTVPSSLSAVSKLPLSPLVSDRKSPTAAMRSKSLTLTPPSSSPTEKQDSPTTSKDRSADMICNDRRELAAISFRETLDALVRFIDARCVLIRIHAVLCCQQKLLQQCNSTSGEEGDKHFQTMHNTDRDMKKCSTLAEQCQHVINPLTILRNNDDDRCIPKCAVSNIEREVRCLKLVLTSIDGLRRCDLFHCVLNVRRVSVLLENNSFQQSCLPIMYIQSSLPKLLALMHVFFVHNVPTLPPPQSAMSHHSSVKLKGGLQTSSTEKKTDFIALFHEFVLNNSSGFPLVVAVAICKARQPASGKPKPSGNVNHSDSKWNPLYVSSPLYNSSEGPMEKKWAQIDDLLGKHCSSVETSDPVKYSIESVESGNIRGEYCHISSVSESLCLVVIQGVGSSRWQSSSDIAIHHFLRNTAPKLCVENLLSADVVIQLKGEIFAVDSKQLRGSNKVQPISLWSESVWSASQQKEVLHSLGLRKNHSPVLAPLRSPYVKRQIQKLGRQKQKEKMSRGHFDFFLGPDIGELF